MKFLSFSCFAVLFMLFQVIPISLLAAGPISKQLGQNSESINTASPSTELGTKVTGEIEYVDTISYGLIPIGDSSTYNLEINYLGNASVSLTNFVVSNSQYQMAEIGSIFFSSSDQDAVPKTGIIDIDGELEPLWNAATSHQILNTVVGSPVIASDLSANWRAMWNEDYLYIAVDVTDEQLVNNTEPGWSDDVVEIHIDGDNSKYSTYDNVNDIHILMQWDDDTVFANLDRNPDNIDYTLIKFATVNTDEGYQMECAIPWSEIGVSVAENNYIGFDVHVGDDDGSERETKISWNSTNDNSYFDPTTFGTIQLGGRTSAIIPVTFKPTEAGKVHASLLFESTGLSTQNNSILLIGEGTNLRNQPVIHVSDSRLTDTLRAGENSNILFYIENLGALPLNYVVSNQSSWFSLSGNEGIVESEETADIVLLIDKNELEPGIYTDTIRILSNDPDNRLVKVAVDILVDNTLSNTNISAVNGNKLLNYPNPFNAYTNISFELLRAAEVGLNILSVDGSYTEYFPAQRYEAGRNKIRYEASQLPQGVYYLQLIVDGEITGGRYLLKE